MRALLVMAVSCAAVASPALAQSHTGTPFAPSPYPDARLVPRGVLRVSFEPEYITYDQIYDRSGILRPLGASLSSDSAGADIFETAARGQEATRQITGLQNYRLTIGALTTERDADIRRFPFNFEFGLSTSLALTASVPIVTTRAQVSVALDTANANAGWNQPFELSGAGAGADQQFNALISQLDGQAAFIEAQVAGGGYGCPTSQMCADAQAVAVRAREMAAAVATLWESPFAPLQNSQAGQALLGAIIQINLDMAPFGASLPSPTLPLPTARLREGAVNALLGAESGGYQVEPLEFVKYRQKLGDIELGVRWSAIQSPSLRALLFARTRLPTGMRDEALHLLDIGTGDRQTDLEGGLEAVFEPGEVLGIALAGSYTLQLSDRVNWLARGTAAIPAGGVIGVQRDLGDALRLSAYPSLRLSSAFTAYGAVHYFKKATDTYDNVADDASGIESLSFGAGVHYSPYGQPGRMPIQAGIDYRAAFRGEGGLAPKDVRVNFYLRLYYKLFGGD